MKITWREQEDGSERGPAVMVFSPDGRSFRGFWWHAGNEARLPNGEWNGTKTSAAIGSCPHWSGSVERRAHEDPVVDRARAGLRHPLRPRFGDHPAGVEARPRRGRGLAREPAGLAAHDRGPHRLDRHAEHNRVLSQQRADAVKAFLVAAGIDAARLQTAGFGASQPVADNATELGPQPEPPGRAGAKLASRR